jgi:hypothetical protein
MKKKFKISLYILIGLFLLIQVYRPERTRTDDITKDHLINVMNVPDNVQNILKRSCYNCHSEQTEWPWYSNIAPASWLVISDVTGARARMNLSEFGKYSKDKQSIKLSKICDMITNKEMPPTKYAMIHRDAVLTQEDKDILCNWANAVSDSLSE